MLKVLEKNCSSEVKKTKDGFKTPIEVALGIDEHGMTTAKKLYEFLELDPTHYKRWCDSNIVKNEFAEENVDYWVFAINGENLQCGRPTQDYKLTSHFAKKLCTRGNGTKIEEARDYFAHLDDSVKKVAENFDDFSPELRLLINIEMKQKQHEKEMNTLRENVRTLEAKVTTHNENYFTVAGYASLRGLNVDINKANMLGRRASVLSRNYGYDIGKAKDARYGTVNTYHVDILKEVFKDM